MNDSDDGLRMSLFSVHRNSIIYLAVENVSKPKSNFYSQSVRTYVPLR